jgi:hypothetical protein
MARQAERKTRAKPRSPVTGKGAGAKAKRRPKAHHGRRGAKNSTSGRRARSAARPSSQNKGTGTPARAATAFRELRGGGGCASMILAAERVDSTWDEAGHKVVIGGGMRKSRKGGTSTKTLERVCHAMGALGHPSRMRMMVKMLEGPATYRTLQKVTKLKAGPLYHHVTQLRLAGLILPKQRDLYELTRGGRNLMLVAMAAGPLIRDRRRRPVAKG